MNTLDTVREIAQDVRDWTQDMSDKDCRSSDLCGFCAIASAELFRRLEAVGLRPELCVAQYDYRPASHVFVMVDDHVVCVTGTQFTEFRSQPVVILHEREAEVYWFYKPAEVFYTVAALRRKQVELGWPQNQIAGY